MALCELPGLPEYCAVYREPCKSCDCSNLLLMEACNITKSSGVLVPLQVSDKSFKTGRIITNMPLIGQRKALLYELHINISHHSQPTIIIVHYIFLI